MQKDKNLSRKKFVFGFGILSAWAAFKFSPVSKKTILSCGPTAEKKTVKMLTQDGQLVEIATSQVKGEGKKITDEELKRWVKKS